MQIFVYLSYRGKCPVFHELVDIPSATGMPFSWWDVVGNGTRGLWVPSNASFKLEVASCMYFPRCLRCLHWVLLQWVGGGVGWEWKMGKMSLQSWACSFAFLLVLVAANALLSYCCAACGSGFRHKWHWLLRYECCFFLSHPLGCNPTPPLLQHQLELGRYRELKGVRFACLQLCLPPANSGYQPMAAMLLCCLCLCHQV